MDTKTGTVAGVLAVGATVLALQGGLFGSPKDQFIKRMADFSDTKKVGGKYKITV